MKRPKESPLAAAIRASLRGLLDDPAPLTPARAAVLAQVARKGADLLGAVEGHHHRHGRRLGTFSNAAGDDDDEMPVTNAETFGASAIRELVGAATAAFTPRAAPLSLLERLGAVRQARDLGLAELADRLEADLRAEVGAGVTPALPALPAAGGKAVTS